MHRKDFFIIKSSLSIFPFAAFVIGDISKNLELSIILSFAFLENTISPLDDPGTVQKSIDHRCTGLFLDSQFYTIDIYVFHRVSTTLLTTIALY